MDTKQVGERLVALCNEGKYEQAVDELYDPNITSVEASAGGPEVPVEVQGIDGVRDKNKWWMDNHTIHAASTEGPYPHHDKFAVKHHFEVTPTAGPMAGNRYKMEEVAVYTVKDGKIVREEFYYSM